MGKYIAYYRVSTKKQTLGLDAQKKIVNDYIDNINGELINEYSEKESGKNNNRIELEKAIEECKRTNSTLIIAKLDRLSRQISFIFALRDAGIDFYCCDIPQLNTLTLGVFATVAQNERELVSKRTKEALAAKKEKGIKLGAPNPKFTEDMRKQATIVNKEKANTNSNNKRAYSVIIGLHEKKYSLQKIANYLNNNDFRTSRNKLFTATAVKRLIDRYTNN
ncbi:MAG: recombinase family protein [Tannerellaceae bacterium]|nr:recombinase family protein [Tannerellaceae bacterium]